RSWVGSVAARERVFSVHGMTSFLPKKMESLDAASFDALSVRFLVTDGRGEGVARVSSLGVVLLDRGERVAPAPRADFGGDVPGLGAGLALSLLGAGVLVAGRRLLG